MSLNNLGNRFSRLGRREDALAASQEAVDIYRSLAQARPDAFLPDLAMSLGALSQSFVSAERAGEAASATHEGLAIVVSFLERHPQAFSTLAAALARDYSAACETAGIEPDATLLARVAQALPDTETSQHG
jgi:tetratricopeptide (TPR) repeat protein